MKVTELFEDVQAPLVWSMIGKILRSGGRVRAYLKTRDDATSLNKKPDYYIISAAHPELDKFGNHQYRLYYVDGETSFIQWLEVMHSDEGELELKKQHTGEYVLKNKSGDPIVV